MSTADPLAALRELCHGGASRARDARLRAELVAVGSQLDRPLQLAVAGSVSAGKSTLINAMLRRSVAPADAGECTRLVTWYEHGERDGVVIVECVDGTVHRRALHDGRLPADLGVDPAGVLRLRVQLADPALRTVTIIDTPGVNTVSAENEDATRRLLFGDAAAEHAQALLYVLRYVQRFDADTLDEFRALSAACGMTAVNTAAVLTQIDRRGDGEEDPWPTARRLVAKASADLGGRVLDVAPVIGLLAETARAGLLGAAEVDALRELAALPPDELDDLLLDLDEFTTEPYGPVDLATRAVLVARLHRYGIREAVARLRRRPSTGPAELHRWLAGCSGYGADVSADSGTVVWEADTGGPDLPRTLADVLDRFARHAGRLKAFAAVGRIRALTRREVDPCDAGLVAELREAVDESRPVVAGLRGLRILAACAAVGRGQLRLDDDMTAELMRLARYDDPATGLGLPLTCTAADVVAAAGEASRRWRRVVALAGPTVGGQRARDVLGALEDIAAAALSGAPAPAPAPVPVAVPEPDPTLARIHRIAHPGWTGLDAAVLDRLARSPALGERERGAVGRLLRSTGPGDALGTEDPAELAARFRVLLHRPLPVVERRGVQAVCAVFEGLTLGASAGGTG
ncbi:dynamin family protein [Pseudonocardia petroleophila]|uniref:Dynamin family protein n=1 Tax=Pseudonocardia petroleophila TaxID=37331 RepID=A0A7G7MEE5_9PSEU|nr:dynamin family protein [Pseudonocardia petroleophila]QNG51156.1 dynamin family protein [Pseudonocardia petroleophila]